MQRFLRRWLETHPNHGRKGQRRAFGSCWHSVNPAPPHLKERGRNLFPTPGNLKSRKRTQLGSPREPSLGACSWVAATSTPYLRNRKGWLAIGSGDREALLPGWSQPTPPHFELMGFRTCYLKIRQLGKLNISSRMNLRNTT